MATIKTYSMEDATIIMANNERHHLLKFDDRSHLKCKDTGLLELLWMKDMSSPPLKHHFKQCPKCGETLEFHHVSLPNYDTYWKMRKEEELAREIAVGHVRCMERFVSAFEEKPRKSQRIASNIEK